MATISFLLTVGSGHQFVIQNIPKFSRGSAETKFDFGLRDAAGVTKARCSKRANGWLRYTIGLRKGSVRPI